MLDWEFHWGQVRGDEAANEPWQVFARREEITITRTGRYTRVVLTRRTESALLAPCPQWA